MKVLGLLVHLFKTSESKKGFFQVLRPSGLFALSLVLAVLLPAAVFAQVPTPAFSKAFQPDTIGPGSTSTLIFTIDNSLDAPALGLAFTDVLPAGIVIATPASAFTTCTNAVLSAPDDGGTISLTGGEVGAFDTCIVTVNVIGTSTATNVSGDLTSSRGNSGSAAATLTVDTARLGFAKAFTPFSIPLGATSALTLTLTNDGQSVQSSASFIDPLPAGMVIATPSNAVNSCGGIVTAVPGTSVISLAGGLIAGTSSCTISADVTTAANGVFVNTTLEVTSGSFGSPVSGGFATAALDVPVRFLNKVFLDDPVAPGENVTLQFSIQNTSRTGAATSIAFADNLDFLAGLAAVGLPLTGACDPDGPGGSPGTGTLSGTTTLAFTGGSLPAEGSCTFNVTLNVPEAAQPGTYTNTTTAITAIINGDGFVGNAATDDLTVRAAPILTKEFVGDPVSAGDDVVIRFTIDNTSLISGADDIAFIDELTTFFPFPVSVTLPPAGFCGIDSSMSLVSLGTERQGLSLTGGSLAAAPGAASSCTFDVILTVPVGISTGTYVNTTGVITATVDGEPVSGLPATDSFDVVAAPSLTKEFTDDPVLPGGTVTLEFTLTHDSFAPGDALAIAFTDDLAGVLTDLTATGLPLTDLCGPGNGTLAGSAGDTLLTFSGGTLTPGETCTFPVTLQVPAAASAGSHTNTTSTVTATVLGLPVTQRAASDDLVITPLMFTKEFIDDPAIPGGAATLRFTVDNTNGTADAGSLIFTDSLSAVLTGLAASGPPVSDDCGGTLSGTTFLTYTGGSVLAGTSCTIDVPLLVPPGAASGTYGNVTSGLSTSLGTAPPATDSLVVTSTLLSLDKSFIDDPVPPGGTVTLEFTLSNLDATRTVTDIGFTDDLGAALSGLVAVPPLNTGTCDGLLTGTSVLTYAGGSLAPGASCTFPVTLQVPAGAASGSRYTNTTSLVDGMVGNLPVSGEPATDDLRVEILAFAKSFNGPAGPGGTSILTFTIDNLSPGTGAADLSFFDNLNAVIPGLTATGLPAAGVCGAGSVVAGTTILTLTGGSLPPGGSCTFDVVLKLPFSASTGNYLNTTSDLLQTGLPVGSPATAALSVMPVIYLSFNDRGRVGGVRFAAEDIISLSTATGTWAKFFDGSDVGLKGINVNGFHMMEDGTVLLSIAGTTRLPGAGQVRPHDVVSFTPTSTGPDTAGTFDMYFDGSDVGLTKRSEKADAVSMAPDGSLVVSTAGAFRVPGLRGQDEDLIVLSGGVFGRDTTGTWERYFDGSDVQLRHRTREDVWGASVNPRTGDLYLTTRGAFKVPGAAGGKSDILLCSPFFPGSDTQCGFSIYWEAPPGGLDGKSIDALYIGE